MKKSLIISFVLLLTACGVHKKSPPPPEPYQHLTSTMVLENCGEPEENYIVSLFGDIYFVLRHKDCAGVDDLFTTHFVSELSELQETTSKLLVILYVRYSDEKLKYTHLKTYKGVDDEVHAVFFRLTREDPEIVIIEDKNVGE